MSTPMTGQSGESLMEGALLAPSISPIVYPESDGEPIAENTRQYDYISAIKGGIGHEFANDPLVFVAADLFWYPVQGNANIRTAPDTLVAFGRHKGDRRSYLQWLEGNIAPQVVFEILSPSNRSAELDRKIQFYDRYGVEECYIYDPDSGESYGFWREHGVWTRTDTLHGWVSPRLAIRFEVSGMDLHVFGRDNRKFSTLDEVYQQRDEAEARSDRLQNRIQWQQEQTEQERQRAEQERQRAEQERHRAEEQRQQAEQERLAREKLLARLRAAGIDPNQL